MNTSAQNWLGAMTLKLAQLDEHLPRSVDWRQALFTMQLRVVGFAYHRDEFTRLLREQLERSPPEGAAELILAPPGMHDGEAMSLSAALATAELLAASQSLSAACDTMFRVVGCALGLQSLGDPRHPPAVNVVETGQHACGKSKLAFARLRESKEFQYLDGLIKLSKHTNPVLVRPRQHLAGCPSRPQLLIRDFHYETEASVSSFAPKWATEFLHTDCERVIELCNQLGETLVGEMV